VLFRRIYNQILYIYVSYYITVDNINFNIYYQEIIKHIILKDIEFYNLKNQPINKIIHIHIIINIKRKLFILFN